MVEPRFSSRTESNSYNLYPIPCCLHKKFQEPVNITRGIYFGHLIPRADSLEKTLMKGMKAKGEGSSRG